MFVLDLIREYNLRVNSALLEYTLAPHKSPETVRGIRDIMDQDRHSIMYTKFTASERDKYKNKLKSDADILKMVSALDE